MLIGVTLFLSQSLICYFYDKAKNILASLVGSPKLGASSCDCLVSIDYWIRLRALRHPSFTVEGVKKRYGGVGRQWTQWFRSHLLVKLSWVKNYSLLP